MDNGDSRSLKANQFGEVTPVRSGKGALACSCVHDTLLEMFFLTGLER